MSLERRKNFIINLSYYLLIAAIIYIVIKYLLGLLTPFIIGFLVAFGLQSSIKFLAKKLRLAKKFVAVILVLLFYIVIGSLVFWLGVAVFAWLRDVVERLPGIYAMEIEPVLARIFISLETFMARYDLTLVQLLAELRVSMSQSIANIVSEISSMAIAAITSTVSLLPRMLI